MDTEPGYAKTGIRGVDELLEGKGLPKGSLSYILGGPGSGKTTFGLQFLYAGAKKWNEPAIYVTMDEEIDKIKANAQKLGLDFEELEKEGKIAFIDIAPIRSLPGVSETLGRSGFTLSSLLGAISTTCAELKAKRLVIDPIVSLTIQYPGRVERRNAVLELMQSLAATGCTCLLVTELSRTSIERPYQFEEFLAQGVMILRKINLSSGGMARVFHIEKMRGVNHDTQPHPYKIVQGGIEVYPSELAF